MGVAREAYPQQRKYGEESGLRSDGEVSDGNLNNLSMANSSSRGSWRFGINRDSVLPSVTFETNLLGFCK